MSKSAPQPDRIEKNAKMKTKKILMRYFGLGAFSTTLARRHRLLTFQYSLQPCRPTRSTKRQPVWLSTVVPFSVLMTRFSV
jgi:hypothetical protein